MFQTKRSLKNKIKALEQALEEEKELTRLVRSQAKSLQSKIRPVSCAGIVSATTMGHPLMRLAV